MVTPAQLLPAELSMKAKQKGTERDRERERERGRERNNKKVQSSFLEKARQSQAAALLAQLQEKRTRVEEPRLCCQTRQATKTQGVPQLWDRNIKLCFWYVKLLHQGGKRSAVEQTAPKGVPAQ